MISGIGTDILAVARLDRIYRRHGERALEKILAPGERAAFDRATASANFVNAANLANPAESSSSAGAGHSVAPVFARAARFLAKRFAAKEAFGKALGTGVAAPATLPNVAVAHDAAGRPYFEFAPELAAYLAGRGIRRAHLSLSDEADYVIAFVVLETVPEALKSPVTPESP